MTRHVSSSCVVQLKESSSENEDGWCLSLGEDMHTKAQRHRRGESLLPAGIIETSSGEIFVDQFCG